MDLSDNSNKRSRYNWSPAEEAHLLVVMEDLLACGYRGSNGTWKVGYQKRVADAMRTRFDGSTITTKQVKSKLIVWRRTHAHLKEILSFSSNFTLNKETCYLVVDNPQMWTDIILKNPKFASYRTKTFPYYDKWEEIFGNDRATGGQNVDHTALLPDAGGGNNVSVSQDTNASESFNNQQSQAPTHDNSADHDIVGDSANSDQPTASRVVRGGRKKRRSQGPVHAPFDAQVFADAIKTMNEHNDRALAEFIRMCSTPPVNESSTRRLNLMKELRQLPGLQMDDRVRVAVYLAKDDAMLDVFYGCKTLEERLAFARLICGRLWISFT